MGLVQEANVTNNSGRMVYIITSDASGHHVVTTLAAGERASDVEAVIIPEANGYITPESRITKIASGIGGESHYTVNQNSDVEAGWDPATQLGRTAAVQRRGSEVFQERSVRAFLNDPDSGGLANAIRNSAFTINLHSQGLEQDTMVANILPPEIDQIISTLSSHDVSMGGNVYGKDDVSSGIAAIHQPPTVNSGIAV